MKCKSILLVLLFLLSLTIYSQENNKNKISITIDDLPLQRIDSHKEYESIFEKLVAEIKKQKTPVTGFVISGNLYKNGQLDKQRTGLLEKWLDAGLDLGNHTYSHKSANKVSISEYEEDILNGEKPLKDIILKKNNKLKYFRHPFLQTGLSLETKKAIESFLKEKGYTIAPVTIDNAEWIFSSAYDKAYMSKDLSMMKTIGEKYIEYMERKVKYWEKMSFELFGRNMSQILLIHSNKLNSDYYGTLCGMMRKLNYDFVSLDEALQDDAYKTEDKFIRNGGISWLHRWAITMGKKREFFANEPECPADIMKYAGVESE